MNKENLQLRRLGENDKVATFDCGDEDLNDFILTDAPLYYRVRLATSYVWEDRITGRRCIIWLYSPAKINTPTLPSAR